MTINTATDLVRYIRHHIAGSEWQDVKAVEDFVQAREQAIWGELRDVLHLPSTDNDKNLVIQKLNDIRAKHYNDL